MRKLLFERYVELNCYRLTAKQLCKSKIISRSDLRALETKIAQAELELIMPKQATNHPRIVMRVK